MKILNPVFIILIFFSANHFAQFNMENFLNVDLQISPPEVMKLFPNEKWEKKENDKGKSISFYGWIEPLSVRASFSFDLHDQMRMKTLGNGKRDEESAKKFYNQFKEIGIKIFGKDFEEKSLFGTTILVWNNDSKKDILLTLKDERAALVIAKKGSFPMM